MIVQKIQFFCKFFFVCVEYCAACKVIILWKFPNSPSWSQRWSYPSAIIYAARLSDEHHRLLNMVDGGIEEAVRPLIPHFHLRITFSIFSQIEQDVCIKKQLEAVGVEFVFRKRAVPLLALPLGSIVPLLPQFTVPHFHIRMDSTVPQFCCL